MTKPKACIERNFDVNIVKKLYSCEMKPVAHQSSLEGIHESDCVPTLRFSRCPSVH